MTREECLEKAKECISGQRYDSPEHNFEMIADLWTAYLQGEYLFSPVDAAMMMALLKIARIKRGHALADSFVDLAGYAACGAEVAKLRDDSQYA